jgi:hypothetical protein
MNIAGRIANKQHILGTLKNPSAICGKIDKSSSQTPIIEGDHQFMIVDLVKMHEQMIDVNSVNAVVPFTSQTVQTYSGQINIYAISQTITVNQETAIINEEAYSNVNT